MSTSPQPNAADSKSLTALLERCRRACARAELIAGLPGTRESFLTDSLEGALQQLELILRVLDDEREERDKPSSLLQRFTRGFARRGAEAGKSEGDKALPELKLPQQGLQGNSWTIPIPELIGFLASGRKSGVLCVDSPGENFLIGLVEGELVHATSDRTPQGQRLGEVLVRLGFLTNRQLERFLPEHADESPLSGEALLKSGMISEDELKAALNHQVQQLFHRLIETESAIFRFREGMEIPLACHVSLRITQLLLESARVQDEVSKNDKLQVLVGAMPTGSSSARGASEEWDSWNLEVLSELANLVTEPPAEGRKDAPSKTQANAKKDRSDKRPAADSPGAPKAPRPKKK